MTRRSVPAGAGQSRALLRRFTVTGAVVLSLVLAGANAADLGREATARTEYQPALSAALPGATAALGIRG